MHGNSNIKMVINYMYLTYYVHLAGIKQVINCRNARSGKLQNTYSLIAWPY